MSCDRCVHSIPFATVEAEEISGSLPAEVHNLGRFWHFSSGEIESCEQCPTLTTVIGLGVILETKTRNNYNLIP